MEQQSSTHPRSVASALATYRDHEVVDQDGTTFGTVTDVLYDQEETTPAWLIVNPGIFRAERYVPVEGSYVSDDGNIVVPFDERWLKSAPKASGDHIITAEDEQELAEHFGHN